MITSGKKSVSTAWQISSGKSCQETPARENLSEWRFEQALDSQVKGYVFKRTMKHDKNEICAIIALRLLHIAHNTVNIQVSASRASSTTSHIRRPKTKTQPAQ
jgi:hypothetical protein